MPARILSQRQSSGIVRILVLLAISGATTTNLVASSPRLSSISPHGVQRGEEHILTFAGSNLTDAQEIWFYDQGLEVTELKIEDQAVKVTVKVADDCRLGEHLAQVRTASGISDFRTFWVEALPPVAEQEPNGDFSQPQAVALNSVVVGDVGNEDVDYYVIEAQKGQRISAEIVAIRLKDALFDPYVAILNDQRFELSARDDTALALQDAFASTIAPEDGKYIIEVREAAYGSGNRYRLHLGTFPRPTITYPAGGKLGEATEVRFLGLPGQEFTQELTLPLKSPREFGVFCHDDDGISPSPCAFRLYEHGNAFEEEPNDTVEQGTPVELPLAFNGIIQAKGDVDHFRFTAKKGQTFEIECYARRVRSALDPVMHLMQADGKVVTSNDDSRGPDSYFRWNVPEDGDYVLQIHDHLRDGGPDFVYRIELQPVAPVLTLGIPRVERNGQYRQQIYVARGNRFGTLISAGRTNFSGDILLEGDNLPAGITMHAEPMPANMSSIPVVFEAAADAAIGGKLIEFKAHHADPKQNLQGQFRNRADFVLGPPNDTVFRSKEVEKLAVAVLEELPFTLEIVQPQVPLVRNGSMQLKIVANRKEGFEAPINVQLPFQPPGVGAANSVTIPEKQNEVLYPLNANDKAGIKKWRIYALGSADVNGTAWVSSQLATLEIVDPFVTFEVQRTACEQGEEAQVYCKLNHHTPFEGEAKVELLGLPAKVSTIESLGFNQQTGELTFPVTTVADSPVGKHKGLFCQVTIVQHGEPIVSRAGGTELQIDKPLPPPVEQPAAPAPEKPAPEKPAPEKPAPEKPAPEKKVEVAQKEEPPQPLSRLEKLRLAYQQRLAARAGQ
jgi:hypothetical protein